MAVVATPHAPSLPLAADTFYLKSSVACLRAVERSPSFHNLSPKLIELRQECVAWLTRVSRQLRFTDETMHLSVSVFDRFIINEGAVSTVAGLSLVAAASLNLAAKIEERRVTGLRGYLAALADRTSTPCGPNHERLLVRMESTVLHTLDFRLTTSTPVDFLGRFMCLAGLDALESTTRGTTASPPAPTDELVDAAAASTPSTPHLGSRAPNPLRVRALRLLELSLGSAETVAQFMPSQLAAGALLCSLHQLGQASAWVDCDLVCSTGYSERSLAACATKLKQLDADAAREQTMRYTRMWMRRAVQSHHPGGDPHESATSSAPRAAPPAA